MNCQDINCQLLVQLIRFKNLSEKTLHHSNSYSSRSPPIIHNPRSSTELDINRQIDVTFPFADQIDMEMIEMILSIENIKIEKKLNENENEYFRRITIQLEQIDG
jgi:hypothetical protein